MTTYKTNELTGDLLNLATLKAVIQNKDRFVDSTILNQKRGGVGAFTPVEKWNQCGELIERFNIEIKNIGYTWSALVRKDGYFARCFNQDLKTAICRCVVKSVFGDEVEL